MISSLLRILFGKERATASRKDDAMNNWLAASGGDEAIKGYHFLATLSLDTPLKVLEMDGRLEDRLEDAEDYREDPAADPYWRFGRWVQVSKSWDELAGPNAQKPIEQRSELELDRLFRDRLLVHGFSAEEAANIKRNTRASQIGQVDKDGGDFLPFLKVFRLIVEADTPPAQQAAELSKIYEADPRFSQFREQLGNDLAQTWFCQRLQDVDGIGAKTAANLYEAGFLTPEDLCNASDEALLKISGVGKKMIVAIRSDS